MPKGKITTQEKYCIGKLKQDGKSITEVAEFLNRPESLVQKYYEQEPETENHQKEKKRKTTFFINKTSGKKEGGVSIMTEAQSSRSDDLKQVSQSKIKNKYKQVIHKINED